MKDKPSGKADVRIRGSGGRGPSVCHWDSVGSAMRHRMKSQAHHLLDPDIEQVLL